MTKPKTIKITGNFTDGEVAELMAAMRKIEQRRPHEDFMAEIDSDTAETVEQIKQRLLKVYPGLAGKPVYVHTAEKDKN